MRLFVGIFPDPELRNKFRDIKNEFVKDKRTLKFVPIDQMHMTIKFLGSDVSEETYQYYLENLQNYLNGYKAFEYEIEDITFGFPYQILPTVLHANVKPNPELIELTKIATQIAKDIGVEDIVRRQEHRKLIHHFTIARAKSTISKAFARSMKEKVASKLNDFNGLKSIANNVSLVQSTLTPTGPIYKILSTIELKS